MNNVLTSFLLIPAVALFIGYALFLGRSQQQQQQQLDPWPVYSMRTALVDFLESTAHALTPPSRHALELQSLYWKTTVLRALIQNGLLDAVDGVTDCGTIGANLGLNEDFTCRFLRAGTSLHLLQPTSTQKGIYKLTATGKLLQRNHPETVADIYDMLNGKLFTESLSAAATRSIKSGHSGVQEAFGMELFEYLQQNDNAHHRQGQLFDRAMNQISKTVATALVEDWVPPSKNATICDMGGGKGTIVAALSQRHPGLKGILFDLPMSAERAKEYLAAEDRINVVVGDFFTKLPEQLRACDVFYLKAIFHDWGDDACVNIIQNIMEIAQPGAMIVAQDIILDSGDWQSMERVKVESDVTMMAMCPGGRERSQEEYYKLFETAGIGSRPRLIKLRAQSSVVEVDL